MDWEGMQFIKQQGIQGWTLSLNRSDIKVKTKKWHGYFEINSMSRTLRHSFFSRLVTCQFKSLRVKLYRNDLKGNKNYFELTGGLSYQGFELTRVKLQ